MCQPTATIIDEPIHPLKQLRDARKLSQVEAAMAIKCSRNMISFTECYNYRPTLKIQRKIAAFFGVEPSDIWPDDSQN